MTPKDHQQAFDFFSDLFNDQRELVFVSRSELRRFVQILGGDDYRDLPQPDPTDWVGLQKMVSDTQVVLESGLGSFGQTSEEICQADVALTAGAPSDSNFMRTSEDNFTTDTRTTTTSISSSNSSTGINDGNEDEALDGSSSSASYSPTTSETSEVESVSTCNSSSSYDGPGFTEEEDSEDTFNYSPESPPSLSESSGDRLYSPRAAALCFLGRATDEFEGMEY